MALNDIHVLLTYLLPYQLQCLMISCLAVQYSLACRSNLIVFDLANSHVMLCHSVAEACDPGLPKKISDF